MRAEQAKIDVASGGGVTSIDLEEAEGELRLDFTPNQLLQAGAPATRCIVRAALETVRAVGTAPESIDALHFTGGSTGLTMLSDALSAAFSYARTVFGDHLASAASDLGLQAARDFA